MKLLSLKELEPIVKRSFVEYLNGRTFRPDVDRKLLVSWSGLPEKYINCELLYSEVEASPLGLGADPIDDPPMEPILIFQINRETGEVALVMEADIIYGLFNET